MADFPSQITSWTDKQNGVDYYDAAHINQAMHEIIAIQNAIGINLVNLLTANQLSNTKPTFTQATTRANIVSGTDTLGVILGKFMKLYTDLTAIAFKTYISKTDLDTTLQTELDGKLDNTDYTALQGYTDTAIANLVNSSPAALDTLNELAAALGNDANFATTITNQIAGKADLNHTHTDLHTHANKTLLDSIVAGNVHTHTNKTVLDTVSNANQVRKITAGTTDPSGGVDGDIYIKYTA